MAWGGSLNKSGSDHIRMLNQAENVIKFLEKLKEDLNPDEKAILSKTIEIIIDLVVRISEKKK
jgi:hypothetical protein